MLQFPAGHRVVVHAWGESPMDALDHHMSLEPQPPPDAAALAHDEVALRVTSCAVGWVDLLMTSGQYQHAAAPPYTPGLEFAGEVVAVGSSVTRVAVGDPVLADGLVTGPRSSGRHRDGGFATYATIAEAAAIPLPAGLDPDQAVNLLGNYETAYHVLLHRGRLRAGEVALIHGASGSTGLAAVHVAKLAGATVIATGRDPDKLARVKDHGADHTLVLGADLDAAPRLRDQVKELTGGAGADLVYDGVGGPISVESLHALRFGGRFCIVGWAATPFVARGKGERGAPHANQLPTNLIQMKGLDVLGCPAVIALSHDPTLRPTRLAWILEHVARGRLRPHVGPSFPLSDYAAAMRAKWASRHLGGCVLHP